LEARKAAIERALEVLREADGIAPSPAPKKRGRPAKPASVTATLRRARVE
jgi:hypothetical protein